MECEICGTECKKLFQVELEGARVMACPDCAKLGVVIPGKAFGEDKKSAFFKETPKHLEEAPEIIEDFGSIVRKAREKMGLTREELALKIFEKASVIHRIETANFVPDEKTIKKLEGVLGVSLARPPES
ncbi:MAG: multiprotein bridging factor aMBF1 [Candidatus Diapherotrites archaeon]